MLPLSQNVRTRNHKIKIICSLKTECTIFQNIMYMYPLKESFICVPKLCLSVRYSIWIGVKIQHCHLIYHRNGPGPFNILLRVKCFIHNSALRCLSSFTLQRYLTYLCLTSALRNSTIVRWGSPSKQQSQSQHHFLRKHFEFVTQTISWGHGHYFDYDRSINCLLQANVWHPYILHSLVFLLQLGRMLASAKLTSTILRAFLPSFARSVTKYFLKKIGLLI